jgi:cytoplasmic iron level regulating protein YaaA (DUF328/UPF0246 family)
LKIIIAPAKKMKVDTDSFEVQQEPQMLTQTAQVLAVLKQKSYEDLKSLWKCSDKLARENFEMVQTMNLKRRLTPALMAYVGIQYQYMAPDLMTEDQLEYVQRNLRILSGFYGILRPFDGIVPYRLEMQARLAVGSTPDLYHFWGAQLYENLYAENQTVINLASKEYEKAVRPFLKEDDQLITCIFGELIDGKVKQKATAAKMARGEMVNFMAQNQVSQVAELQRFDRLNYRYQSQLSSDTELVFVKEI